MAYTTESKIEALLLHDIDPSFTAYVSDWIGYAKNWIDNYCDTTFDTTASATKYYDGSGTKDLIVDVFEGTPTVSLLDSEGNTIETLNATDFVTAPYNETTKNCLTLTRSAGLLSDADLINDVSSSGRIWPQGTKTVKVVATFGRSSVPPAVELAASMIVAKIINEGLRGGQVKAENLGSYNVTYRDINEAADVLGVKMLLDPYRQLGV